MTAIRQTTHEDPVYIVTGCTGYVGNVLTKKLMAENRKVIGLARSEEKVKRVFGACPPEIVYGDIRNPEDIKKLFFLDAEYTVIHTVAYVTIGEGSEKDLFDITVAGTRNILSEAVKHRVKKYLQISSSEAIPKNTLLDENLTNYIPDLQPANKGYSAAKRQADALVLNAMKNNGLNASILMLAGVLGPGDYSNSHMTQVLIDFVEGRLPASVDAGYNDFDIRDVADVLPDIIEKSRKGEVYLFANKPDKINDILGYVAEEYHKELPITLPLWTAYLGLPFLFLWSKLTGKRPLYTRAALSSLKADADFPIGKAVREFGYRPRPLKQTVLDHVEFLKENGMIDL